MVPDLDDFDARIRAHNPPDITVNVNTNVDSDRFSRALSGLAGIAGRVGSALTGLLKFGAIGIAAAGAAQGVLVLGAALAPAAGIIAAFPALILGFQAALGALRLALTGVSEAFGAALTGTGEEFTGGPLPGGARCFGVLTIGAIALALVFGRLAQRARPAAVACAALVAIVGALNGWTLLSAQTAYAAARDGLFPARFAVKRQGVSTFGVTVTVVLTSLLTVYNYMAGTARVFEILVLVTTFTATVPYLLATAAQLYFLVSGQRDRVGPARP
ncbi:hypothetical protein ABID95_005584 [Streptomyces atratus]